MPELMRNCRFGHGGNGGEIAHTQFMVREGEADLEACRIAEDFKRLAQAAQRGVAMDRLPGLERFMTVHKDRRGTDTVFIISYVQLNNYSIIKR